MTKLNAWDRQYAAPNLNGLLSELLPRELKTPPLHDIDCNGFLTLRDLGSMIQVLRSVVEGRDDASATLLELGCGTGGLASFLARRFGCHVRAIDYSEVAISTARKRSSASANVEFFVAEFDDTHLERESAAAIYSLDALYLSKNASSAIKEARRVLLPGGSLVFTTYWTLGVASISPVEWLRLAEESGLLVNACLDITTEWRQIMRRKHEARLRLRHEVRRILGERASIELQVSEAMLGVGQPSFIDATHRFEIRLARGRE